MVVVWVRSLTWHPLCGSRHLISPAGTCSTPVRGLCEAANLLRKHVCACRDCWWSAGGSWCWQTHHNPSNVSGRYLWHDCWDKQAAPCLASQWIEWAQQPSAHTPCGKKGLVVQCPCRYNPYDGTGTFSVLADSQIARLYHSNAFLLIDGTVSCKAAWLSLEGNKAA